MCPNSITTTGLKNNASLGLNTVQTQTEKEQQTHKKALAIWQSIREQIRQRKAVQTLSDADLESIAMTFSDEVIDSVIAKRKKRYG